MRRTLLATVALFGFGLTTAQAGDIHFNQFKQSAQSYDSYWSVWAENNAPLFGDITLASISNATGTLKASTQVLGAVNTGVFSSTITNTINSNGPLISQAVNNTSFTGPAPNHQQGINIASLNLGGPTVKDLPKITSFAVNNASLYGSITVQSVSTMAGTDLSTTVAGAVNSGTFTSNVSKTVSVIPH